MIKENMTPEERLVATINFEPVDRICCAPGVSQYAGQYAGITNKEFVWDWDKAMASLDKLKEDYPVWDCNGSLVELRYGPATKLAGGMRIKLPGEELRDNEQYQMVETEIMSSDEYKIIREQGFAEYQMLYTQRSHSVTREQVLEGRKIMAEKSRAATEATLKRGQSCFWGPSYGNLPFDAFSMMRSMECIYKDMFRMKDEMLEYLQAANDFVIGNAKKAVAQSGIKRVFVGGMRGSGQFISKRYFESLVWPYMKEMVDSLFKEGIVAVLHLDADWTNNLEYFLELPAKSVVLQFDSATDIFKAKEILHGHCCLNGDVSPALLSIGSPAEVDEYCRKLITVVGKGGGLLYGVGCAVPFNAKHENVKAFFDAVEKYGVYN